MVQPAQPSSGPHRVQGSSRLAFGITTTALVTLASGGTAFVVAQATGAVSGPTALPGAALPAEPGGSLVVARPAGTPVAAPRADRTEQALRAALATRRPPGRRTLTAPLVHLGPAAVPAAPEPRPAPPQAGAGSPGPTADQVPGPGHLGRGKAKHLRPHAPGKGKHAR